MRIKHSNPRACSLVSVYNPGVCCFVYLSYLSSGRFGKKERIPSVSLEKISEWFVVVFLKFQSLVMEGLKLTYLKTKMYALNIAIFSL